MIKIQTNYPLIKFGLTWMILSIMIVFQGCQMKTETELAINTFLQEMNPELAKKIANIEQEIILTQEKIEKLSELKQKHPKYANKIDISRQQWERLQHQLKETLTKIRTIVESSYVAYELDQIQGGNQFNNLSEKLLTSANSVLTSAHTTKQAIEEALYELENSDSLLMTEEDLQPPPVNKMTDRVEEIAVEEIAVEEIVIETTNKMTINNREVEKVQAIDTSTLLLPSTIKPHSSKPHSSDFLLPTQLFKVLTGHYGDVNAIAFSPNGRMVASGSNDNTVKLWDINTGKALNTFQDAQDDILTIAFHPNGHLLAAAGNDQTIQLWNLDTNEKMGTLTGHTGVIHSIAFSPDGQTLVSGSWDKTVRLWEINSAIEQQVIKTRDSIYSVAFSPNGQQIAVGSFNETITLWAANTGQLLHTLQGNGMRTVYAVAFSPDGQKIISGDLSNHVRVWERQTGESLFILKGFEGVFGSIFSVTFSPNGLIMVASGSGDETIKWWDANTGKELHTHQNEGNDVRAITFSPDGRMLASGHDDNTIKLWKTP